MTLRAVVLALVMIAGPAIADDERPESQRMRFIERGDRLHVTARFGHLFDAEAYAALDSGFESTIVIRMWIYPRGSTQPIAFHLLQRRVIYALWEEVYVIEFDEPGGAGRKVFKDKRKAEALKRLTTIDDVAIARLADIPLEDVFHLALEVELNPVSDEILAQVRRWLSQGTSGGLDRGGSFFGSFVSVFVNPKIAGADRALRIRSQPFFRPRP